MSFSRWHADSETKMAKVVPVSGTARMATAGLPAATVFSLTATPAHMSATGYIMPR